MRLEIILMLFTSGVFAQANYGPQGQYLGYSQAAPSGVTTVYNGAGQSVQSYQTDSGQTSFYGPQGQYQGTSTTPVYSQTNTNINTPRYTPQAPIVKGW